MPNTSATGGYLAVTPDSFNLSHVIHDFIMGFTGYDATLVRPMYQPNAPVVPAFGTDWIAYNVKEADTTGYVNQELQQNGTYTIRRMSKLIVSVSFYGTNSYQKIKGFKNSLELTQNWEMVRAYGMGFNGAGNIIKVPELHNMRWLDRYNIEILINQSTTQNTSIISLVQSSGVSLLVNK